MRCRWQPALMWRRSAACWIARWSRSGSCRPDCAIYSVGALEIPLDVIFQGSVANVLRASLPALVRDGNRREIVRVIA